VLEDAVLDQLFRAARSTHAFTSQPVTDDLLQQLYELLKWGPTAWNAQPGRYMFVRSPGAATRAAVPAGESPVGGNCPVATVVISGDGEGDRSVESPDVKASGREASNLAGRSKGEPVSPENAQRWECRADFGVGEGKRSREGTGRAQ
jgi:nitroreductase